MKVLPRSPIIVAPPLRHPCAPSALLRSNLPHSPARGRSWRRAIAGNRGGQGRPPEENQDGRPSWFRALRGGEAGGVFRSADQDRAPRQQRAAAASAARGRALSDRDKYADDMDLLGQACAFLVCTPHAHARNRHRISGQRPGRWASWRSRPAATRQRTAYNRSRSGA